MTEVGGFVLEREVGRGATAQVFLAYRKEGPSEPVALKIFHPGLWDRENLRKRALSEFKTASSLRHPNIVRVMEPLWESERPAVAMEFVDGASLEEFQNRLPYILPEVAVLVVIDVLSALDHAHKSGVIHRDLKPANILVSKEGRVLVSDFGLAKMTNASRLTLSGTVLGSPDFMSPEQARGDVATPASDVFSAGAILYFLVTGTRPFTRHSPLATLAAVSEAQFEAVTRRNPKISSTLAALIHRALSKEVENRFASAQEFREALVAHLQSLGLVNENFTLGAWVRTPADTVLTAMRSSSEALVARAEAILREQPRDWEEFLQCISHLSVLAPESAAIPRLMNAYGKAKGKRRLVFLRTALAGLAVAAGIAIGLVAGLKIRSHNAKLARHSEQLTARAENPRDTVTVPRDSLTAPLNTVTVPLGAAPAPAPAVTPDTHGETVFEMTPAPKPRPRPKAEYRKISLDLADGIHLFWDGYEVNKTHPLGPQRVGPHRIRLEKAGSMPITQTVQVRADEPTIIRVR